MEIISWGELPSICNTEFVFNSHSDRQEGYPAPEVRQPYGIATCSTEYVWDGVRFTAKKEWFGAPGNSHLVVFRQTIEPFSNCEFILHAGLDKPSAGAAWQAAELLELDENICGYRLTNDAGRQAVLLENTLVSSFSIHVDEKKEAMDRTYMVTAFEEAPVKLERYAVLFTDEEPDFQEKAYLECRRASKMRFDELKGRGAWEYSL